MSRSSFRAYMRARDVEREYPGVRGFGFVRRLPASSAAEVEAITGVELREITPNPGERYVVQAAEPVDRNRAALGLDIASDPVRRAVAALALRTGEAAISPPITLVQAAGKVHQGFGILLPIYAEGAPHRSAEERDAACFGWSFASLVSDDLLADVIVDPSMIRLSLRDLANDAEPFYGPAGPHEGLSRRIERPVFGRVWEIEARDGPAFVAQLHLTPPELVFSVAAVVSTLLAALLHLFLVGLERARQLYTHQRHLASIVEGSSDAILSETLDGVITSWNRAAERIFGYGFGDALGQTWDELVGTSERELDDALVEARSGHTIAAHDVRCRRSDGSWIDVAITLSPIMARDGRVIGVGRMIRDVSARKESERRLQEFNAALEREVEVRTRELAGTSRHLQTVVDSVPAAIAYWDRDQINHFANATYTRWVGGPPLGRHIRDVLGEKVYAVVLPNVEAALRGENRRFEQILGVIDGQPAHVLAHYIPDVEGDHVRGFFVMVQDVTEVHEGRSRLADFIRGTDAGTWEWSHQTGEFMVNERWAEMIGYRRDEISPVDLKFLFGLVHPDDLSLVHDARRRYLTGEADVVDIEARLRHRDGHYVWVRDCGRVSSWTPDGTPAGIRGTREDVTARREAQRRLAESEAFLERTGHIARIGGWQLDVATQQLDWTRETKRIHDVPLDYVPQVGEALGFYPGDAGDQIAEAVREAMESGVGYDLELPFVTTTGRAIWVRTICEVEFAGEGAERRPIRLWGAFQDISDQRAAEDALREATRVAERASAAKSEFVANMSHEIRTPLHAILGIAHLLDRSTLSPEQMDFVAKIQLAGRGLLDVVNDILDLSKIEASELGLAPAPFDLRALLAELQAVLGAQAASKGLTLTVSLPDELPPRLVGDASRLRQLLTNLIGNAIKFTDEGGVEIRVEIDGHSIDQLDLRLAIRDTGIGMPPEALDRIFHPFVQADSSTTRRHGGTGLGLSIVHRLATLMGGAVEVTSTLDEGSEFRVLVSFGLPGADEAPTAAGLRPPAPTGDALVGVRILVVDDSEINREIACQILAREGAVVDSAGDGREAYDYLAASPRGVDLVLMDIQMPVMDGNEATRRIRRDLGLVNLPVIALSAGTLRVAKERALDAGIDDFLSKPLDPRVLVQTICRHVEKARVEAIRRATARHAVWAEDEPAAR